MTALKENDLDVLAFVARFHVERGYAPSLREIADALLVSVGCVQHSIRRLVDRGLVQREVGRARTVRVTNRKETTCST